MDLDYRGSSGYRRDWRTGVYLHIGGPDLDDVLGAVDYLRSLGNVDMKRPEAYRRSSPVTFSGLLKNPLLVVHGIVDNNVMFQDAVELTEKLIHEGKEFSEIYYPEESHGFVRDETLIDSFRRTAEWMDRYLK